MKKQMTILLIVVGMLIGAGGCATIMNGSTDTVNIRSTPPASFSVISVADMGGERTTVVTGVTPQNVTLQRKTEFWGNHYLVKFEKAKYINKTIPIKETMSGWFWGNILIGGVPGIIIDGISGACEDLHDVSVRLVPINN